MSNETVEQLIYRQQGKIGTLENKLKREEDRVKAYIRDVTKFKYRIEELSEKERELSFLEKVYGGEFSRALYLVCRSDWSWGSETQKLYDGGQLSFILDMLIKIEKEDFNYKCSQCTEKGVCTQLFDAPVSVDLSDVKNIRLVADDIFKKICFLTGKAILCEDFNLSDHTINCLINSEYPVDGTNTESYVVTDNANGYPATEYSHTYWKDPKRLSELKRIAGGTSSDDAFRKEHSKKLEKIFSVTGKSLWHYFSRYFKQRQFRQK